MEPCTKVGYPNRNAAMKQARIIRKHKRMHKSEVLRAYPCPHCPQYHLTSERERVQRKTANERGYGHRWQKRRLSFLAKNPLCLFHVKQDQVVAATVVDHIIPHKGDQKLFWDENTRQ